MTNNQRRGPWSAAEDRFLMELVGTQGALNWVKISQMLDTRTPKQCRERYHQNLKPSLNHNPISPEEGAVIEQLVNQIGKRWAEIARRLHNRSDNAVKNWWNGSMNRRRRLVRKRLPSVHDDMYLDNSYSHSRAPAPIRLPPVGYGTCCPVSPNSTRFPQHPWHGFSQLPSPSTTSPSSGSLRDGVPSLMSDCGSYYSTSPTMGVHSDSPVDLPPLRLTKPQSPPLKHEMSPPSISNLAALERPDNNPDQFRLAPILNKTHSPQLPTAPSSPVTLNASSPKPKDSRMKLDNLLS